MFLMCAIKLRYVYYPLVSWALILVHPCTPPPLYPATLVPHHPCTPPPLYLITLVLGVDTATTIAPGTNTLSYPGIPLLPVAWASYPRTPNTLHLHTANHLPNTIAR